MNVLSGRRFLFINYMINSGGMNLALGSTLSAAEIYCLSDFSDDKLLPAIHQIKVTQRDCFYCFIPFKTFAYLHENQPFTITVFPSQIAYICRHPQLKQFDLSSVIVIMTGGSGINPTFERQLLDKIPNLMLLLVVIHSTCKKIF